MNLTSEDNFSSRIANTWKLALSVAAQVKSVSVGEFARAWCIPNNDAVKYGYSCVYEFSTSIEIFSGNTTSASKVAGKPSSRVRPALPEPEMCDTLLAFEESAY